MNVMKTQVYIETFGCQMNVADAERAAAGLRKAGFEITPSAAAADVVLLSWRVIESLTTFRALIWSSGPGQRTASRL